ncbi:MAG: Ppx/GppA phosphatase family protein, partial [Ilumatobacteraceae bacterium]
MSSSDVVAAIDVGTNSVHMVVARVGRTGFDVISTEKEVVRLGAGLDGGDDITPAAIERGVGALVRMSRIAEAHGALVRAVATSAVREAPNREDFLGAVRSATGIDVEVISGGEEARLIHLGVGRSLDLRTGSVLSIDIGGGSTEFCVSVRGSLRIAQSLKMGTVRMTDSHLPGGVVTDNGVKKLREKVRTTLAPLAHDISRVGFDRAVVSSGTNEALARMAAAARGVSPQNMNGFVFTARELDDVTEEVLDRVRPEQRVGLDGLDAKRADIIAAGAVILREIGRVLKIPSFEYSDFALREGVLVDAARRLDLMDADPLDPGLESATRLAERFSVDMRHSTHVADLAACLLRAVGRHYETDLS